MAASTENTLRSGMAHVSLKFTLLGEAIVFLLLILASIILLTLDSQLNLMQNSLYSIKSFSIGFGLVSCVLYGVVLGEKDTDTAVYRSNNKVTIASKISSFLKCVLLFCLSCVALHIVIVLFGAPVQETVEETFILAVLLSTLSTLPCLCILGSSGEAWSRFAVQKRPQPGLETCIMYTAVASLIGAWLGAFTIPLDWDRPWQVWPIPCAAGAILGHTAALPLGFIHLISLMSRHHSKAKNKYY